MAIKYRASWNTSENEALIQFDFIEDRGASGTAQVMMPRSVMSLSEEKQAEEAFRRFIEIHGSDFVTDERIQTQGEMVEVTSRALMEMSMILFQVQQQISGLDRRFDALEGPEEPEMPEEPDEPEEEQTQDEDSDNKN